MPKLPASFTSSTAAVIVPLPFAMKLPTRAISLPFRSSPLISKAYCPLRLELVKPTLGGGGGGVEELLPPHAAANRAAQSARATIRCFTAHLRRFAAQTFRSAPTEDHARFLPRVLVCPFEL